MGSKTKLQKSFRYFVKDRAIDLRQMYFMNTLGELIFPFADSRALIVGVDGLRASFKTALLDGLEKKFTEDGVPAYKLRETDHDPFKKSRNSYLESPAVFGTGKLDEVVIGAMHTANRAHVADKIRTNGLQSFFLPGNLVLCDHTYSASLFHYLVQLNSEIEKAKSQYASVLEKQKYERLKDHVERMTKTFILPDISFILNCKPEIALARYENRFVKGTREPQKGIDAEYFRKMSAAVNELVPLTPNAVLLDTSDPITSAEIIERAYARVREEIKRAYPQIQSIYDKSRKR